MSVRLMGSVFELDIASTWKLVLLAMADHARDDGTGCYPSVELLAKKTSQSRRGVQKILRLLEDAGLIAASKVSRGGPRHSTEYKLTLHNREPRSLFASTQPRTPVPETANIRTPNREPECAKPRTGFARTIKNHQEPSLNLRPLARPSSRPPCGNREKTTATPQQIRFATIRRLAKAAAEILDRKPECTDGDLAEDLKQWAANEEIPYFDAWPGAATPIEQAITIARERRKAS